MDVQGYSPGSWISGRYRLECLLGQGGMGTVWRAQHGSLNAPVAIKLIDPRFASSPEARARFMREAQAAAALRSPHVVQILDFGMDQETPFIAMELLHGESLARRLVRAERLTPHATSHLITQVARAMSRAHAAGIVHRDLKPDNIFLVTYEDEEVAKVLDFGIAKATGAMNPGGSRTQTGVVLGTPYYMSPEQARGQKCVDWRTDLWALGIITYECLVGRRPFVADGFGTLVVQICTAEVPIPSQDKNIPAGFEQWFRRAIERAPDQRFQSARELATTLQEVLTGRSSVPNSPADHPSERRVAGVGGKSYLDTKLSAGSQPHSIASGGAPSSSSGSLSPNSVALSGPQTQVRPRGRAIVGSGSVWMARLATVLGLAAVVIGGVALLWVRRHGSHATPEEGSATAVATQEAPKSPSQAALRVLPSVQDQLKVNSASGVFQAPEASSSGQGSALTQRTASAACDVPSSQQRHAPAQPVELTPTPAVTAQKRQPKSDRLGF